MIQRLVAYTAIENRFASMPAVPMYRAMREAFDTKIVQTKVLSRVTFNTDMYRVYQHYMKLSDDDKDPRNEVDLRQRSANEAKRNVNLGLLGVLGRRASQVFSVIGVSAASVKQLVEGIVTKPPPPAITEPVAGPQGALEGTVDEMDAAESEDGELSV